MIFTICNSRCEKVMFLHLSVTLFTGGGMDGKGVGGLCDKGECMTGGCHVWQQGIHGRVHA